MFKCLSTTEKSQTLKTTKQELEDNLNKTHTNVKRHKKRIITSKSLHLLHSFFYKKYIDTSGQKTGIPGFSGCINA